MRFANACLIALLWVCGRQYLSGETIAIKNVTVIDPREGTVQPNRNVVVEDRRIQVVNGVTSVRDMGSDLKQVLEWRAQIEAGTRLGPRIKTAGQILESRANVE